MGIAMVVLNIVMNITLNKWWAGGNWMLILNTMYLITQTILSWPLIFEIPIWLNKLRFFRFTSVAIAFMYNFVYLIVLLSWVFTLFFESEATYESYQFFDILIDMFLAYNVLFHLHIMPVNFAIVFKEILLELFPPLLKQNAHTKMDLKDAETVVNPKTYLNTIEGRGFL